jgi:hypothetical protein
MVLNLRACTCADIWACAAAAGAVKIPLKDVLGACWKVLREEKLPVFQLALLVIPIISEQNKAMVWGSTARGVSCELRYNRSARG